MRDRLDMSAVARECDLAVCHAPHGTTAAMLLAGKPLFLLPIFLEQGLMARAVCRARAGAHAPAVKPQAAVAQLERFVTSLDAYTPAARRFAARHAHYDPVEANEHLVHAVLQWQHSKCGEAVPAA